MLVGAKAVAVKLLLDWMPEPCLKRLQEHVGRVAGFESCATSEDALRSRKLYPGYHFRVLNNKAWANRGKVTEASMLHMFCSMIRTFEDQPVKCRVRPTKAKWKEANILP